MSNQLKLLFYIAVIAGVILYIQDSFNIFDISFTDGKKESIEEKNKDEESESVTKESEKNYVEIFFEDGERISVDVEVADTEALRTLGLSNRRYLGDYNGMLFIFDDVVSNPFWMKDTYINLDIIFIDEKGFIVDIKKNNQPCTPEFCPYIFSSSMYKYVLEVNGGFSDLNDIKIGQSVVMYLASK